MKRWLTLILLLISVTATVIPCCTDDDCAEATTQQDNRPRKTCGACSPFYSCGTCTASADPASQKLVITDAPSIFLEHTSFYLVQLGSYCSTPFQPPRVG